MFQLPQDDHENSIPPQDDDGCMDLASQPNHHKLDDHEIPLQDEPPSDCGIVKPDEKTVKVCRHVNFINY